MAARLGVMLATALLALVATTGAEAQQVKPPANDDCLVCHSDPEVKRENGTTVAVNADAFGQSKHGPLACVDCHKDLAATADFPHASQLAAVNCASCHDDQGASYRDSIHGRARNEAGLTKAAPSCANCHGSHDIKGVKDEGGRVFRANVPATCGSCHEGIIQKYETGVHAEARQAGQDRAPVCIDCHSAHAIQRTDLDRSRLSVTQECGTCHAESMRTYRDTFHGQVTNLGFVRVATCADCHGAHDIYRRTDVRSTVSDGRRGDTCRSCHEGADDKFALYDPHADRHDPVRNPSLYRAGLFMDGLLLTVFSAFGIHTALWLVRGLKERRRGTTPRAH